MQGRLRPVSITNWYSEMRHQILQPFKNKRLLPNQLIPFQSPHLPRDEQEEPPQPSIVLELTTLTPTNHTRLQDNTQPIWPNQIITKQKENYWSYWKATTNSQNKLQCYLALNKQYAVADYLTTVTDDNLRKTLTRYRLSDRSLDIEKHGSQKRTGYVFSVRWMCLRQSCIVFVFLLNVRNMKDVREKYFSSF